MRKLLLSTGIIFALLAIACDKEYPGAEEIFCPHENTDHPKNQLYQEIVDTYFNKGLPGLTVLIHTPEEGFWEGSAGYACIEDQVPMTPCHVHYAASIPKSFTAVAILQQIESGNLSPDNKMAEFLEDETIALLPNAKEITIRQLLNHTSGLPDWINQEFLTNVFNDPTRHYTLKELIHFVDGQEALSEPGTVHNYADVNYNLLALILDNLTGNHIQEFEENIFAPLGLQNTNYSYTIDHGTVDNLVSAYVDTYSNGSLENITDWEDAVTSYLKGSGGMTTNAFDLALFIQGVFKHTLVSEESLAQILSDSVHNPLADTWMNDAYSLGFMIMHTKFGTWYGHAGRDPGAAGYIFYNPEHQVTLVAMTNIGTLFSLHYTQIFYGLLLDDLMEAVFKQEGGQ